MKHQATRRDGLLDVQCWCGRMIGTISPEDLKAGRAPSCGIGCSRVAIAGRQPRSPANALVQRRLRRELAA